jgi:hypothetical protein
LKDAADVGRIGAWKPPQTSLGNLLLCIICGKGILEIFQRLSSQMKGSLVNVEPKHLTTRFYDLAAGYPKLSFDEAARRCLGPTGFPRTKNRKLYEKGYENAFDLARK